MNDVHDKIDQKHYLLKDVKEIMENCIELKVPSKVDEAKGDSWGKIQK